MTQLVPNNPENVNKDLAAHSHALRVAARARLDALADFDLPDDITPLQVLEHCRRKRLAARLRYQDMLKREVPREAPERIEAVLALELAEHEAELFLDRFLDVAPSIKCGMWPFITETRRRWFKEADGNPWALHYFNHDEELILAVQAEQLDEHYEAILDEANASEWVRHNFRSVVRARYPGHDTYRQVIEYIEGLDYCNRQWRDAFESGRKASHGRHR
jgi:hypothetical protein